MLSIPSVSFQVTAHVVIVVPTGQLSGFAGWYRRSRTILRARLLYASMGWLTFCAPNDGEKKGLKSKPKIGGFRWDATTDVENDPQGIHRLTGCANRTSACRPGRERVSSSSSATRLSAIMVTSMALAVLAAWEAENGKLPAR